MSTAAQLILIEEYLHTWYRPDYDFVDGRLEERNVGERDHNRLQLLLAAWFLTKEREWHVFCLPEQRTRVSGTRVRIPDVCLLRGDAPREQVTLTPPLLCIEILSPEDRLPRVFKRLEDFLAMGVEHLWILDPEQRIAYVYSAGGATRHLGNRLSIPGTPIYVDLAELFTSLG